jgi:hypothetical protein
MRHISEFLAAGLAEVGVMSMEEILESSMEAYHERLAICLEAGIPEAEAKRTAQNELVEWVRKHAPKSVDTESQA